MSKVFICISLLERDEFENDMENLLRPECQFSTEDFYQSLIEDTKDSSSEGTRVVETYISEEKTVQNKGLNFRFEIQDENMILSIKYVGFNS